MTRLILPAVLLAALLLSPAALAADPPPFVGTWTVVTDNGVEVKNDAALTFTADAKDPSKGTVAFSEGGEVMVADVQYEVTDAAAKKLTFTAKEGDETIVLQNVVYSIDGDTLTLRATIPGADAESVSVLKRAK